MNLSSLQTSFSEPFIHTKKNISNQALSKLLENVKSSERSSENLRFPQIWYQEGTFNLHTWITLWGTFNLQKASSEEPLTLMSLKETADPVFNLNGPLKRFSACRCSRYTVMGLIIEFLLEERLFKMDWCLFFFFLNQCFYSETCSSGVRVL